MVRKKSSVNLENHADKRRTSLDMQQTAVVVDQVKR